MNQQATLERLNALKLPGMATLWRSLIQTPVHQWPATDQLLAQLLEAESDYRQHQRTQTAIREAHFRYQASLEEIIYWPQRGLDRNLVLRLSDLSFIERGENLLLTGATGCGKSYLATAFGYQACLGGLRVGYYALPKLVQSLHLARADGSFGKELARLERLHLLILDDWGLAPLDMNSKLASLQIVEDR